MRIRVAALLLIAVLCVFARDLAAAQNTAATTAKKAMEPSFGEGPVISFADFLRAHDIDTSKPSLIEALGNTDPEIRSVAALKLAEDHHFDAIPSIKAALTTEMNTKARIAMYEALYSLHDSKGLVSFQAMCSDQSLSIFDLVEVVQQLNNIGQSSRQCAAPILGYLNNAGKSSESAEIVLPALPDMYRWVPQNQAGQILTALEGMLADRDGFVRLQASNALVQIKAYSAACSLHDAISRERDSAVRSALEADLLRLEKKQ